MKSTGIFDVINRFFDEILRDPQPRIFHYTNSRGLLGILNSMKLWLTDIRFLNDPDEQSHGLMRSQSLVMKKLSANLKSEKGQVQGFQETILTKLQDRLKKYNDVAIRDPVYCASFCEVDDLLSQWKGYSDYGDGYSIGFNTDALHSLTSLTKYILTGRVIYNDELKTVLIDRIIEAAASGEDDFKKHGEEKYLNAYVSVLNALSYFMKSQFFSEEREWRLVYIPTNGESSLAIIHRIGSVGIIPYVEIDIAPIEFFIGEVVAGPRIELKQQIISLRHYIDENKIRQSTNTLR